MLLKSNSRMQSESWKKKRFEREKLYEDFVNKFY